MRIESVLSALMWLSWVWGGPTRVCGAHQTTAELKYSRACSTFGNWTDNSTGMDVRSPSAMDSFVQGEVLGPDRLECKAWTPCGREFCYQKLLAKEVVTSRHTYVTSQHTYVTSQSTYVTCRPTYVTCRDIGVQMLISKLANASPYAAQASESKKACSKE